jgi:hypothetical protein
MLTMGILPIALRAAFGCPIRQSCRIVGGANGGENQKQTIQTSPGVWACYTK